MSKKKELEQSKIIAKENEASEKEGKKRRASEMSKKKELEQSMKQQKRQKQQNKDEKKKRNKKKSVQVKDCKEGYNDNPNIKPVPLSCLHLVNDDDVVYVVPGNGCCGPNCACAFLFQDEVFGPKLRKQMNLFQVEHWEQRYKHLTQCFERSPFQRNRKGKMVSFMDPEKLLNFLKYSKNAAYMWTDSEDRYCGHVPNKNQNNYIKGSY